MKVWRVENFQGSGPYQGTSMGSWADSSEKHNNNAICPEPRSDAGLADAWMNMDYSERDAYLFGFSSLEQLQAWFSETELAKLKSMGYYVTCFEIPEPYIIVGSLQLIFKKVSLVALEAA